MRENVVTERPTSQKVITIRPKLFCRLALLALLMYGGVYFYLNLFNGTWGWRELMIVAMAPVAIYGIGFIAQTLRITLSDESIDIYWYAGIPWLKLWEHGPERIPWEQVQNIFLAFPKWIPITLVGVQFRAEQRNGVFFLGSYMTEKKRSILFMDQHLDASVFDSDTRGLLLKYREDVNRKAG